MDRYDLLIIGGGINGAAIARDAAMREKKVLLVEKDDLAARTSSASSKLVHGGLRYLEHYEFRLVREALKEREILLRIAPHIAHPLAFVLPHACDTRPWWMIRAGLFLYDLLSLRGSLPRSRQIRKDESVFSAPLKENSRHPLALYWDAWIDDARLVVLNAVDAHEKGAEIATRTEFLTATRKEGGWHARLSNGRTVAASAIVNAAGPWVAETLRNCLSETSKAQVRLIKGSHILIPRLSEGDHAYILQQPDSRVVFALPYGDHMLVGTTDIPVATPEDAVIDEQEKTYLLDAVNRYFVRQTGPRDIFWSYSGVRALFDDGAAKASAITRDYHLELDEDPGPKLLSVFGGKITTARALAEEALDRLDIDGRRSTAFEPLPGGDIYPPFLDYLGRLSQLMPPTLITRMSRAYGTRLSWIIGSASGLDELGHHFGAGLYEAEIRYLVEHEFARTAEDILWRRTKLGLALSGDQRDALIHYLS